MVETSEWKDKTWANSFERNRYFYGKMLTVRDFQLEQQYGIEKDHMINRLVLGSGLVCGLEVGDDVKIEKQQEKYILKLSLSPGVALDYYGREIVVSKSVPQELEFTTRGKNYIYIEYAENDKEFIPDFANGSSQENYYSNRTLETYKITVSDEAPQNTENGATQSETTPTSEDTSNQSLDALVQQYYSEHLRVVSPSKNTKLLLAVIDIPEQEGQPKLNKEETEKCRQIVYSNPMLYNLISKLNNNEVPVTANSNVKVFTGIQELEFDKGENIPGGTLVPVTVTVNELKEQEPFSVMLAPILPAEIPPISRPPLGQQQGQSGIHFIFGSNPQLPRTYVAYVPQPYNKTFEIHGLDPNLVGKQEKVKVVYWITAGAYEVNSTNSIRDNIMEFIKNNPNGITLAALTKALPIDRSSLESELTKLVSEGAIQRVNGNKFRPAPVK